MKFNVPVTDNENLLAIMLIQNVYKHPEFVDRHHPIKCSDVKLPYQIANKIHPPLKATSGTVTLPPEVFANIIEKLMQAELVLRVVYWNGEVDRFTSDYLPVTFLPDDKDPGVIFMHTPQCYFEENVVNGEKTRQLIPNDEMMETMRACAKKAGVLK